jgi:hypothetical protein
LQSYHGGALIKANPKTGTEGEKMQQDPNLGGERERVSGDQVGASPQTMSAQDERTWSIIAHLSVLMALVGLMPFGALLVWLLYKDRSPEGALPRPAGALESGSLDRDPRDLHLCQHRIEPRYYRHLHVLLVAHPGADTSDSRLLRSLQGEPGRRVPLPVHRGQDRRSAGRSLRRSPPSKA